MLITPQIATKIQKREKECHEAFLHKLSNNRATDDDERLFVCINTE